MNNAISRIVYRDKSVRLKKILWDIFILTRYGSIFLSYRRSYNTDPKVATTLYQILLDNFHVLISDNATLCAFDR